MYRSLLRRFSAIVAISSLAQTAMAPAFATPIVTAQPPSTDPQVALYFRDPNAGSTASSTSAAATTTPVTAASALTNAQLGALVRQKISRVFVIFNENESFDHEYGTFPGVNGIYSDGQNPRVPGLTPGYLQNYITADGVNHFVTPFLLGPGQNANVQDSTDHSHTGLNTKLHVINGVAHMDSFSEDEYLGKAGTGSAVTTASDALGRQYANLVMSHIDCNTIPFFWQYANRFVIFDNIFATEDTPSAPNAVAMIAGQSGETQWVKHGSAGFTGPTAGTINGTNFNGRTGTTQGPPIMNDPQPFYGSEFDISTPAQYKEPTSPSESFSITNIASNLTSATVLLTLGGTGVKDLLSGDLNKAANQADIQNDINTIYATRNNAVSWRWYQNGYDHEPTDPTPVATHANWVSHHEGPGYFGYIYDNVNEQPNLKGEGDFFTDIASGNIPQGVVYVRGGYQNIVGLRSSVQNSAYPGPLTSTDITTIQTAKSGDDDHPSYSDRMISEAATARIINAIASNPAIWAQSAIIITYDESDGQWDHVPPTILSYGPDGLVQSRGIRVPLIVISPYGYAHVVSHAVGDHNAVIETINAIYNLPPLSTLPDEASALAAGNSTAFNAFGPPGFQQLYLGPRDTNTPLTDSLLTAFDPSKLTGATPILPASYAMISDAVVNSLPHYGTMGCLAIGVRPEDIVLGISAPPPANFNSLPSTLPRFNSPYPN